MIRLLIIASIVLYYQKQTFTCIGRLLINSKNNPKMSKYFKCSMHTCTQYIYCRNSQNLILNIKRH